ncbi:MAG: substrate-binding domain-containing protein [Pseudomonadota bacterium]
MNLKELAASLNLSQTTVSRALNGYPEVRAETRARVLKAARAAHYEPNTRAQRLATGRSMTVGHVIPLSDQHQMVNPIFSDFLASAGEVYAREGYDLLLSIVGVDEVEAAYRKLASNGSVDGLMVHGPRVTDARIPLLKSLGLPFIVHGRSAGSETCSWLDIQNRAAFEHATNFLIDLGHCRIGLINGLEVFDFAHRRRQGYDAALQARGVSPNPAWVTCDEMTEEFGYRSANAMLDLDDAPTAFLTSSILSAIGVRRAVAHRGLTLGREVSLITHDDVLSYLRNGGDGLAFTATRSPIRDAGRRAAEMLMSLIDAPQQGPLQELWPVELTLGRTTGPAV